MVGKKDLVSEIGEGNCPRCRGDRVEEVVEGLLELRFER